MLSRETYTYELKNGLVSTLIPVERVEISLDLIRLVMSVQMVLSEHESKPLGNIAQTHFSNKYVNKYQGKFYLFCFACGFKLSNLSL